MNFLGFIIRAPFLPWVFCGLSLLLGGEVQSDLVGIAVGHIYYFLEDVFPVQEGGFKILNTPEILKRIFNENYTPPVDETVEQEQPADSPAPADGDELPENDNPGGYNFGGNN